jgi:hypothetical protein
LWQIHGIVEHAQDLDRALPAVLARAKDHQVPPPAAAACDVQRAQAAGDLVARPDADYIRAAVIASIAKLSVLA